MILEQRHHPIKKDFKEGLEAFEGENTWMMLVETKKNEKNQARSLNKLTKATTPVELETQV